MYELTNLLFTVAGCSATIVAIVGGFIASKLIAISSDRHQIISQLKEVDEELSFKLEIYKETKYVLEEDDALDYIKDNIEYIIGNQSLSEVYKEENRNELPYDTLKAFWDKAIRIYDRLCDIYKSEVAPGDLNEDDIPRQMISGGLSDFEYKICQYILKKIDYDGSSTIDRIAYAMLDTEIPRQGISWYQGKRKELDDTKTSMDWLGIQQKNLLLRKDSLKSPTGMKSGIFIFSIFSLLGIVIPLSMAPYITNDYSTYIFVKASIIIIFTIGLISIFMYLINLLRWKE